VKVTLFHTLPSEGRTSSEVYARELGRALRRLNDPSVITDWEPEERLPRAARKGTTGKVAGYLERYMAYQWQVWGKDAEVNHIVDHGYGHLAFSLNYRRTVVSFHDALLLKLAARELENGPMPTTTILGHRLSLRAIRKVARVITDSASGRRDFLRFVDYDPERVTTIPLGISDIFKPSNDSEAEGALPRPLRILHVGHCEFYKNVEGILSALPAIGAQLDFPVVFVKVGEPFTVAQQALIERLGISSQVKHLGKVPLHDLPAVYSSADVLLMPSWHEGFGLPVLEAMACGTPVVAADRGSLPEVVGDAGLLVDPMDQNGLAATVVRLLGDSQLRDDLRRRGLERARCFTWERTAQQTLAVYQAVHQEAN
jgi:glycosyltransferase involved in cell wall biosynthesis